MRLRNKVALVTGGSRGIGAAAVRAFAREGAQVAYSCKQAAGLAAHADLENAGCRGFLADLADPAAPEALIATVLDAFGRIDILINNAGVISRAGEWELDPAEWDRVQGVNVRAVFFASRAAARSMRERGAGSIVSVSSIAGQHGGIAAENTVLYADPNIPGTADRIGWRLRRVVDVLGFLERRCQQPIEIGVVETQQLEIEGFIFQRRHLAAPLPGQPPANRARRRYPEPLRRFAPRQPTLHRLNNPAP
jgi:hypothetical protein